MTPRCLYPALALRWNIFGCVSDTKVKRCESKKGETTFPLYINVIIKIRALELPV